MTLLGTITTENLRTGPALCCSLVGVRYNGVQHGLLWFTDPVTKSTLALPEQDVTIGNIWRKVHARREEYRKSMLKAK